jgi:hypothetical protein
MPSKLTPILLTVAAAACAVAAPVALAAASPSPSPSPSPGAAVKVGPKQPFEGLVNGKASKAVIHVLCPGIATVGHPLAHQVVKVALVLPPLPPHEGFTGAAATSIDAWLIWPAATPPPPAYIATFTSYGAKPIPVSIAVPCSGSGEMLFLPAPGSPTVRAAIVSLTFVNIGALTRHGPATR